jgi:hypothetical protein
MEMAIVLGIIGIVLGAVWIAATKTSNAEKSNDAVSELQMIAQNIVQTLQGQTLQPALCTTGATFPCDVTKAMGTTMLAIPSAYVTGVTAVAPWSGSTLIIKAIEANQFRVSFFNVPTQGCMALLLQGTACQATSTYSQPGCPVDAFTAADATTNLTKPASTGWQAATSMTVSQASSMCLDNTTAAVNSVEFDYAL